MLGKCFCIRNTWEPSCLTFIWPAKNSFSLNNALYLHYTQSFNLKMLEITKSLQLHVLEKKMIISGNTV